MEKLYVYRVITFVVLFILDTFKIRNTFGYCNCSRATDINPMAAQCTSQTAKQNGVKVSCVVTDLVSFSAVVRKNYGSEFWTNILTHFLWFSLLALSQISLAKIIHILWLMSFFFLYKFCERFNCFSYFISFTGPLQ